MWKKWLDFLRDVEDAAYISDETTDVFLQKEHYSEAVKAAEVTAAFRREVKESISKLYKELCKLQDKAKDA